MRPKNTSMATIVKEVLSKILRLRRISRNRPVAYRGPRTLRGDEQIAAETDGMGVEVEAGPHRGGLGWEVNG